MAPRQHEPKNLGKRLGSADLVKKGRRRKGRRTATGMGTTTGGIRVRKKPPWTAPAWLSNLLDRRPKARPAKRSKAKKKTARPASNRRLPRRKQGEPSWLARLLGANNARPRRSEADELSAGRNKVFVVMGLLFVVGGIILGRSVQLQLFQGDVYADAAVRQVSMSAMIKAKRGVIKDRNGAELAITVDVDSIYAEPRRIPREQAARMAAKLAPILKQPKLTKRALTKKLQGKRAFTYLRRRVPPEMAQGVRDLGFVGIGTQKEPKRFYPNVSLAAHVLGFTNHKEVGQAGVERNFNAQLQGKSAKVPGLRDNRGKRVYNEGFVPEAVLEGSDITLTLDRHIQHEAEAALKDAVTKHSAKAGVAVVMDPKTGDVLAMASYPTYNPNLIRRGTDLQNRAVTAIYEPGSTMKMVTIAAALEDVEGFTVDKKIDCEGGRWRFGHHTIRDANHKYDELTVTEILQKSSNICTAKIGVMLGRDRLHQWLRKFGLAERTGIELPGEARGLLRAPDTWRDIGLANIAFGQGLNVTPIQILQAAATIANDGVRERPRLVLKTTDKLGHVHPAERPEGVRVLSKKNARLVAKMMVEVTKKGGTAEKAAIPGFNVAGKTGTAQKIDPVTRAYSHELYVASFVGFVPAEKPEVAILVLIDQPKPVKGGQYGGVSAAPAFRRIALAALSARNVFPNNPQAKEDFLASYRPQPIPKGTPNTALTGAEHHRPELPPAASQSPDSDGMLLSSLSAGARQLLMGSAESAPSNPRQPRTKGRMPNFTGLKLHEVLNRSAEVRCDPVVRGTGRVVKQSPRVGAAISSGSTCTLTLAPRG